MEANLNYLLDNSISNLNISILTTHKNHNRRFNLDLIADSLNANLGTQIIRNVRDDLLLEPGSRKISGTAARISHGRAYHHFTLLVDVCKYRLSQALKSPNKAMISTNATLSVPAKAVGFIKEEVEDIQIDRIEQVLIDAFQSKCDDVVLSPIESISNRTFDGVEENLKLLQSWEWIYGKSPKFSFMPNMGQEQEVVEVENGVIIQSSSPNFLLGDHFSLDSSSHDFACNRLLRY
uniref:BPL/LPL catalytic domain-containing protein n=1 Tax=Acrobeloides nanus TaxID=290746 RepID=A0A914CZB0_9BILA